MLEAKLVHSQIQAKYIHRPKEEVEQRPCPEDEPVDQHQLGIGANYVVVNEVYRDGQLYAEISSFANEPAPCVSIRYPIVLSPQAATKFLLDFMKEFDEKYLIRGIKPLFEPDKYSCPYVHDPEGEQIRTKMMQ